MNWAVMEDGKEKYSAYLCSREWSVLKESVHDRANGLCERCLTRQIEAVHHLTYARKYRERLDDLQGLCGGCHSFVHGKSDVDPRDEEDRPFSLLRVFTRDSAFYVDCGYYCVELVGSLAISISRGICDKDILMKSVQRAIELGVLMDEDRITEETRCKHKARTTKVPFRIEREK